MTPRSPLMITSETLQPSLPAQSLSICAASLIVNYAMKRLLPRTGEKILRASTTLDNVVRFVTYVPAQGEGHIGCLPDIGTSFYWSVNLSDGTPSGSEDSVLTIAAKRYPARAERHLYKCFSQPAKTQRP